jgi:hypothetical protein
MHRRELVRLLGTAMAVPVFSGWSPERLWAFGERTHARTAGFRGRLDPHELETVAVIAELILPRSDTPGARDVGVPEFIDLLMTEWYDEDQCARFLTGLAAIDALASEGGAGEFIALPRADQIVVVDSLDASLALPESPPPGSAEAAYRTLKSLTVFAYFTSREVQRDVLKVNIWPNRYDGCIPT